ncbi:MAG: hypothetical protein ACXVCY_00885 [Pseudobdellovibrionaceae bacterium]
MQNSTLDNSFVNRLKQILASRYGKGLQIRQLMDLSDNELGDLFTRGNDLHILIRTNGAVLGKAVIPSAIDLNIEKRNAVAQLVRMALEPAMYKWYLETKESNLENITKAQYALDNIHVFGDRVLSENFLNEDDELNESPINELNSVLIHLEGCNETINKKVALTVHDLTPRWAFVPFSDIKVQLHSAQDIAKMGAMTIYVENVETLNPAEQELLTEYISEQYSDGPLIITSSAIELKNFKQDLLNKELINSLSENCFEVDRAPLSNQGLKEVLELFFAKEPLLDA